MQRLQEAPSEQARSWLEALDGKLLERRMEAAAKKACEYRNHHVISPVLLIPGRVINHQFV
jgi:hypothetical protein